MAVAPVPSPEGVSLVPSEEVVRARPGAPSGEDVCPLCGDTATVDMTIRVRGATLDVTGTVALCAVDAEHVLGIAPNAIARTGKLRARTNVGAARDLLAAVGVPADDLEGRHCDYRDCRELATQGARLVPDDEYAHRAGPLVSYFCDRHARLVLPHARLFGEPWQLRRNGSG